MPLRGRDSPGSSCSAQTIVRDTTLLLPGAVQLELGELRLAWKTPEHLFGILTWEPVDSAAAAPTRFRWPGTNPKTTEQLFVFSAPAEFWLQPAANPNIFGPPALPVHPQKKKLQMILFALDYVKRVSYYNIVSGE